MFKQIPQQQQQFKNGTYIKCGKKGHFIKDCKGGQQSYAAKGINTAQNNNYIKAIRECLIKHFAFCYNSAYRVHKDTKYSVGQWPQELKLSHAKAIQELDDKQDRIYYRMDIYSNTISLKLVMYSIKEVNKDVSDEKMS